MATGHQWDQKNEGKLAQPFDKWPKTLPNRKMLVFNGYEKYEFINKHYISAQIIVPARPLTRYL